MADTDVMGEATCAGGGERGRAAAFELRLPRPWLALALALACMALTAHAAPPPESRQTEELSGPGSGTCLAVWGIVGDGKAMLRVAMPPMDFEGTNISQAMMSRLLSAPEGAGANTTALAAGLLGGRAQPLPPVVRLAFDGGADSLAGRHADAERKLAECKRLAAQQHDSLAAAACANNLAVALAAQGRHAQARQELEQALQHYGATRAPPDDVKVPLHPQAMVDLTTSRLPGVLALMSPEQRAQFEAQWRAQQFEVQAKLKESARAAWRQNERLNTLRGIERTRLNLGNLALAAGRLADAESMLRQALDDRAPGEDPSCRAAAAVDLARLFLRLGRADESRALLARHRTGPIPDTYTMFEMGAISLAPALAGDTGSVAAARREAPTPPSSRRDPMEAELFKEPGGRFSDDVLGQLWTQATGQPAEARQLQNSEAWRRLAMRAAAGRRPDLAFAAHAELMRHHKAQGNAAAAIFQGKRAVQVAQAGRAALDDQSPSRDARRAFLRERRQVYVQLTQLLLDARRLQEAEAALQLLKEDEGQQFVASGSSAKLGALTMNSSEQGLLARDESSVQQLLEAEQGRIEAASRMPLGAGVMLMLGPDQIEVARLKLGLAVDGLPAQLKRSPLARPSGGVDVQGMLRELRSFLLGPERRLESFLTHLIEDAARFTPRVGAKDLARLSESLKRVRQIQAELAPLLRDEALADGAGGSAVRLRLSTEAKAEAEEADAWQFVGAEPAERIWRSMRAADEIEARYLREAADNESKALGAATPSPSDAGPRDPALALLAGQPVTTALLYYLPGDDRLDILLVGASGRQHWRLAVSRAELDRQVEAFVQSMRRTDRDPRPAAQGLYARLFAPVAQAVADSGAKVLALSLAEKLRFVPFAALHDGTGWLVERYALAIHPGGPLGDRLVPASANWRVAAFGASQGGAEFPPLLSVRSEIGSVVRQSGAAGGALPGEAWLDKEFTAKRLRAAVGSGAQVLHIASHFRFVGGDARASYLLLGDGGKLSLQELAGADYRFDRTELVTLSACATGVSADDTYGQEVDGLAALLMGQGAPSVLASLWEVNDRSTATLMSALYRLREDSRLSRAFALQQAQWAMIRSQAASAAAADGNDAAARGVTRIRLPGEPEPDLDDRIGAPALALGYGHPFYWAAFVLMGNWR